MGRAERTGNPLRGFRKRALETRPNLCPPIAPRGKAIPLPAGNGGPWTQAANRIFSFTTPESALTSDDREKRAGQKTVPVETGDCDEIHAVAMTKRGLTSNAPP